MSWLGASWLGLSFRERQILTATGCLTPDGLSVQSGTRFSLFNPAQRGPPALATLRGMLTHLATAVEAILVALAVPLVILAVGVPVALAVRLVMAVVGAF